MKHKSEEQNKVTITLTKNEAEALFCVLRFGLDRHHVYNNTDALTFHDNLPDGTPDEDEEQDDVDAMNAARIAAAKQLFTQMTEEARERHGYKDHGNGIETGGIEDEGEDVCIEWSKNGGKESK